MRNRYLAAAALLGLCLAGGFLLVQSIAGFRVRHGLPTEENLTDVNPSEASSPGRPAAGSAEPSRRVRDDQETISLHVTDARTGAAIAAAMVHCLPVGSSASAPFAVETNQEGVAALPIQGVWRLRVEHEGYVSDQREYRIAESPVHVSLEPAATLTLAFADSQGTPIQGVRARLLPPLLSGPAWNEFWRTDFDRAQLSAAKSRQEAIRKALESRGGAPSHLDQGATDESAVRLGSGRTIDPAFLSGTSTLEWSSTSDQAGLVTWRGLPPRAGYRWALVSDRREDIQPPHEQVAVRAVGRAFHVTSDPPRNLSGRFDLLPGETTRFEITIKASATVSGRIQSPWPLIRPARVTLFDVEVHKSPEGTSLVENTEIAVVRCQEDGSFEVTDVPEGPKVLRALLRPAHNQLGFAAKCFDVHGDEPVDLGTISPNVGSQISGQIDLRLRNGERIDPAKVYPADVRLFAALTIATDPLFGGPAETVDELAGLELGQPFVLHGIPDGRVMLQVDPEPEWPAPIVKNFQVRNSDFFRFVAPHTEPVALGLPAKFLVSREVRLRFPPGIPQHQVEICLTPTDHIGSAPEVRLSPPREPPRDPAVLPGTIQLEQGTYEYAIHSYDHGGGPSVFARGSIDMHPGADAFEISLGRGVSVSGQLVNANGVPIPGKVVMWKTTNWPEHSKDWIYRTFTDPEGRFQIDGVPLRSKLIGYRKGTSIDSREGRSGIVLQLAQ